MKGYLMIAVAALALAAASVRADDDADMKSAKQDLESARGHLRAAQHDYDGHRKDALEAVGRALHHVDEGLAVATRKDAKTEKKVNKLEKKQEHLDKQIEKLKN